MRLHEENTISVVPGVDQYFTVQYNGVPHGGFYYQPHSKQWQGVTRANRLLTPTPSRDECMHGVIDAIGE